MQVTSGKALETKFQLLCTDIDDIDKPLQYNWDYIPGNKTDTPENYKQATFPKQGLGLSEEFQLPAGNPDRGNKVKVRVTVSDLFGAAMEPFFLEISVGAIIYF